MKDNISHIAISCGLLFFSTYLTAQPRTFTKAEILAVQKLSGISGPGKPVVGNGGGGWRSGFNGVSYSGPYPDSLCVCPDWGPYRVDTSSTSRIWLYRSPVTDPSRDAAFSPF